jgi:hypothetical protein
MLLVLVLVRHFALPTYRPASSATGSRTLTRTYIPNLTPKCHQVITRQVIIVTIL